MQLTYGSKNLFNMLEDGHNECLEHKPGKYMLPTHDKRHN